jgi:hypothetical protein
LEPWFQNHGDPDSKERNLKMHFQVSFFTIGVTIMHPFVYGGSPAANDVRCIAMTPIVVVVEKRIIASWKLANLLTPIQNHYIVVKSLFFFTHFIKLLIILVLFKIA